MTSLAPTIAPADPPAVEVRGLSHRYPSDAKTSGTLALDRVELAVRSAEIFAVLGPNGGGKTTLFRILSTMMRPSPPTDSPASPTVRVLGVDPLTHPNDARRRFGVVFQSPSLDAKLTARENLWHHGLLHGIHGPALRQRIDQLLEQLRLHEYQHRPVERLSGGTKRRLEIARAMLHRPPLLLMDEPSTGLDPGARADLWRLLRSLRAELGVTILLTTHLMDEADRCDRLAILARGRVVACDTPDRLKQRIGGHVVHVTPEHDDDARRLADDIAHRFAQTLNLAPTVVDHTVHLEHPDGPALTATLAAAFPGRVRSITVGRPTLEDVFLDLTGHRFHDPADRPA